MGTNLGDRELNLLRAVAELGRLNGSKVTALSRFYETSPVGMPPDTPLFYNGIVRLTTALNPLELLSELQRIEQELFGRKISSQPISRYMDLDLLLYGDEIIDRPELVIPHPRMTARRFVLLPLAEIAPDIKIPGKNSTVSELLAGLISDELVRPLE